MAVWWAVCLSCCLAAAHISVHDVGENRQWFEGEANMVSSLDGKLPGLDDPSRQDPEKLADAALKKATMAEEETTGALVDGGATQPRAEAVEEPRHASEKQQEHADSKDALDSTHVDTVPDAGAGELESRTGDGSGVGVVKKSTHVNAAANEIVDSAFAHLKKMELKERSASNVPRTTRTAVEQMIETAKRQSEKREQAATQQIEKLERDATKRLAQQVAQYTKNIDVEIAKKVRSAEGEIESKMEQQVADQIAASQVESLFENTQASVESSVAATAEQPSMDSPRNAESMTTKSSSAHKASARKEEAKQPSPEIVQSTAKGEQAKHVAKHSTGQAKEQAAAKTPASKAPAAPAGAGHDDMELRFGPASVLKQTNV